MEQLVFYVSDPFILWLIILILLALFIFYASHAARRYFIAQELIYGVCNPWPSHVEYAIAQELAHARIQEGEIEVYKICLSTLTAEEVQRKQELHRSAKAALERVEHLKMYARYFRIQISDERIDALAVKSLRERSGTL